MKNKNVFKNVISYTLLCYALLGVIISLDFQFDLDLFEEAYYTFGRGKEGGASTSPIFFGLAAVAGAILLSFPQKKD